MPSIFKQKALRRLQARRLKRNMAAAEQVLLDHHITWAEDERTAAAKADLLQPYRRTIDYAHARTHKANHVRRTRRFREGKGTRTRTRLTAVFVVVVVNDPCRDDGRQR